MAQEASSGLTVSILIRVTRQGDGPGSKFGRRVPESVAVP